MRVAFVTNIPSPYRVDFFNEFGKFCDLTVLYERRSSSERDEKWKGISAESFQEVFLDLTPVGVERSKGSALRQYIAKHPFDCLIFGDYISFSEMEAITYCRLKRVPYIVEYDGGFNRKDNLAKRMLKKFLLGGAVGHLTTADEHIKYLKGLGIDDSKIYKYPFTSVRADDIASAENLVKTDRKTIREKLEIHEDKVVLSVGRFIPCKGFDILMKAAAELDKSIGVYIVGGEPTKDYLAMKNELALDNVHFIGFKTKSELAEYYAAADLFVLPTRGDVWGLVINEAMAYGLPVVTTDRCIAGLELVHNGGNGFIVPPDDSQAVADKINLILHDKQLCEDMRRASRRRIEEYTIEKMAQRHIEILSKI